MSTLWTATLGGRAMNPPAPHAEACALATKLRALEQRLRGVEGHRPRAVELRQARGKGGATHATTMRDRRP